MDKLESNYKGFLKAFTLLSSAQAFSGLAIFALTIISARILSVSDFGLLQALLAFFTSIDVFHLPIYLASVHITAVSGESKVAASRSELVKFAISAGLLVGFVVTALSGLISKSIHSESIIPLLVVASLLPLKDCLTAFYGSLQGQSKHFNYSKIKLIESILCFVIGIFLLKIGFGVSGVLLGYALSAMLINLWLMNKFPISWSVPFTHIQEELSSLKNMFCSFGILLLIANSSIFLSRLDLAEHDSGLLGALYSLRSIALPFAFSLCIPFYLEMRINDARRQMFIMTLKIISAIGVMGILISYFLSPFIISTIYSSKYIDGASVMPLYVFAVLLEVISMLVLFWTLANKNFLIKSLIVPSFYLASVFLSDFESISSVILAQIIGWGIFVASVSLIKQGK